MRRLLALVLVPALFLTACGSKDDKSDSGGLSDIKVSGASGKAPSVKDVKGFTSKKIVDKVLTEGEGAAVTNGDTVSLNYVLYGAKDGKSLTDTYSQGGPVSLQLNNAQDKLLSGPIVDHKIGSRFLIAAPATDFYGDNTAQSGLDKTETLVLVADLVSKFSAPKATGAIADVKVTGAFGKAPAVTAKSNLFVAKTESKVLKPGKGAAVKQGDKVSVRYVGVDGRTGKTFDSSYTTGKPAAFTLDPTQVIPGFVTGLKGKKLGSRVLVTIPYTDGYGATGNPQAGINGGDTLIFVIDLVKKG